MVTARQRRSLARLIVILAGGVAAGLTLDAGQSRALNILGAVLLVVFVVAIYEASVASLSWLLGRLLPRTTLPNSDVEGAPVQADRPRRKWDQLRAAQALALLGAYLAGQTLVWLAVGVVAVLRLGGDAEPVALEGEVLRLAPAGVLISILAGGAAALLLYRRKAAGSAAEDLGWGPAKPRDLVLGLTTGSLIALAYILGAPLLAEPPRSSDLGFLSQLVSAGGIPRLAWSVAAVVLAPPVEEFVFRGALFTGLARSWGLAASVAVTAMIFALLHLPDVGSYWPAVVTVLLMGFLLALLRARTGRIAPCIAAHCAYNFLMVLTAYGIGFTQALSSR